MLALSSVYPGSRREKTEADVDARGGGHRGGRVRRVRDRLPLGWLKGEVTTAALFLLTAGCFAAAIVALTYAVGRSRRR
jgi:hypothetical protein